MNKFENFQVLRFARNRSKPIAIGARWFFPTMCENFKRFEAQTCKFRFFGSFLVRDYCEKVKKISKNAKVKQKGTKKKQKYTDICVGYTQRFNRFCWKSRLF